MEDVSKYEEESKSRRSSVNSQAEAGFFKKTFFWICGIESSLKGGMEATESQHHVDTSIDQDPKWAVLCDINAIIAIALSGFCIAFFNKYD